MRNSEAMAPKSYLALTDLVYNINYEVKRVFLKYRGQQTGVNALYLSFSFFKKTRRNPRRGTGFPLQCKPGLNGYLTLVGK